MNLTVDLAALAKARDDRCNQQLLCVGMDMRIQPHARCVNARLNVGAAIDMNGAIGAEFSRMARAIEVKMGNAFGRKGIAEDGVQDLHVQIAHGLGLPAGMGKVFECAGDFHGVVFGCVARP